MPVRHYGPHYVPDISEIRMRKLERLLNSGAIRLAMMVGMFLIAYQLTAWSMHFGDAALLAGADLLGAAAIIGAASAAPIGILTMLANKYLDTRHGEINERIRIAANRGDSDGGSGQDSGDNDSGCHA